VVREGTVCNSKWLHRQYTFIIVCCRTYRYVLQLEMLLRLYVYMCTCTTTYFDFIYCTATYWYVLRPEIHVRLICVIKFYLPVLKKVKVAHTRLPSVGFRSWSRFLAVSQQVTWVINSAVGCHYFQPGLQLPPATLNRAATNFAAWWTEARWVWIVCLRLTRQRRDCDMNPGPSAPESSTLITRLPLLTYLLTYIF